MSTAIQKRSRGVHEAPLEILGRCEGDGGTRTSSPPPNVSVSEKTRATSSSERTSHSVTSGLETLSARSRTLFSIRSPWYVNATCAPSSAS